MSKGKSAQAGSVFKPCLTAEVRPEAARRESKADTEISLEEGGEELTIGQAAPGVHFIRSTAAASKVYLGRVLLANISGSHDEGSSGRSERVVGFQRSAVSNLSSHLILAT